MHIFFGIFLWIFLGFMVWATAPKAKEDKWYHLIFLGPLAWTFHFIYKKIESEGKK